MSKFFTYGTELQELEQLMMLVPNFIPRKSEVIVMKSLQCEKDDLRCVDYVSFRKGHCSENTCSCFAEKISAGVIRYKDIVKDYYKNSKKLSFVTFKKRLG